MPGLRGGFQGLPRFGGRDLMGNLTSIKGGKSEGEPDWSITITMAGGQMRIGISPGVSDIQAIGALEMAKALILHAET